MARSAAMARDLRTLLSAGAVGGLTDGQLLERFLTRHGEAAEAAFAALVERHGPMVLGVCRRVLVDPRDVEDAFQATFLVLVRKARSVRVDDSLGRWLYGVTRRVAGRARGVAARRRVREGEPLVDRAGPDVDPHDRLELRDVLDEELGRLPEKYRAPMVLCYLEGLTHDGAAAQLGWPVGTVRGRLARARERLRTRLAGRGLALLGPWPGVKSIAVVPPALAESTVSAAMRLAAGGGGVSATVLALAGGMSGSVAVASWKSVMLALVVVVSAAGPAFLAGSEGQGKERPARVQAAPVERPRSKGQIEAIKLAEQAFGPKHWAADPDLAIRYYNHERGYWMYGRSYKRLNDGKRLQLDPFAIIWKSRDGKRPGLLTATGDRAILDLDEPLGKERSSSPMKVLRTRIEGNVQLRDDRGTPDDPADDLVIGPVPYIECQAGAEIRSETKVAIRDRDTRVTGFDLRMQTRAGDRDHEGEGARVISLQSQVHVIVPADRQGILPGEAGSGPLEIHCSGPLRMEVPAPRRAAAIGPPAPPPSIVMEFAGAVQVRCGPAGQEPPDQLDCDELRLVLVPAPAPSATGTAMSLGDAVATGSAVWLRSQRQGLQIRCNELRCRQRSPEHAGEIFLSGNAETQLWIEKIETVADGLDRGKVKSVTKLRATDATIVEDGQRRGDVSILVHGPGSFETRPAPGQPVERAMTWQGQMILKTTPTSTNGR